MVAIAMVVAEVVVDWETVVTATEAVEVAEVVVAED